MSDDKREGAIVAAYFLAQGSFGTARDNGIRLIVSNGTEADEFKRLAQNFQRIAELIENSGYLSTETKVSAERSR